MIVEIELVAQSQTIKRAVFIETPHMNRPFDDRAAVAKLQF